MTEAHDDQPAQLAHTDIVAGGATPERWIWLLHGIFGRGRNWASIARRLTEARPEWGAVLVDLREHGESLGFTEPHTLEAAAADLRKLAERLGRPPAAVLGHSFGGKVALAYGSSDPDGLEQIWVIDSTPAARPPSGSAWEMIERIREMPDTFPSRKDFAARLREHGYAQGVGSWMAMNLERHGDDFRWSIDFAAMEDLLRDFFRSDRWAELEDPAGPQIHLVRALESSVLDDGAAARARTAGERNGRVHLHELAGGHWLNIDNPEGILELLVEGLPRAIPRGKDGRPPARESRR
ncbi:alpha/beta fold hydrolase [soil metagenome]